MQKWHHKIWLRVKALWKRPQLDRDLEDELAFHLAMRAEKNRAAGIDAKEAGYAAHRQFGNVTRVKERSRDMWTFAFLETIGQDVRCGFRVLRKSPWVTALAVLALALGIGANTAIFSVAIAILQKPVSFPNLDRLVAVVSISPHETDEWNEVTPADYLDWKSQSQSFEAMTTMDGAPLNLTAEKGEPERVRGNLVPANYFEVLGAAPAIGRPFLAEEEQPGHDQEAILSYGLWQRRFASDRNILGKIAVFDDKKYTIVGVMGKEFNFPSETQVFLPLALDNKTRNDRSNHSLEPVARLKRGVSVRDAQAEMFTIMGRLQQQFPMEEKEWSVRVMPLTVFASGKVDGAYARMLIGAVVLLMAIACANVANLLFARSASRQREMAVRRAMGASRVRIIRQLLLESLLLAGAGACLGLLIGQWGISLLRLYMPPEVEIYLPYWRHVRLEPDVFLYSVAVAFLAGIISGLAPAFQSSKADIHEELKEGGRGNSGGRSRQRLRGIFVVSEVALSLVLLIGAGLMSKGSRHLMDLHQNLDPERVLTMRINLPETKYKAPSQQAAFYEQVLRQFAAIPGVQSSAVTVNVPFGNGEDSEIISIKDRPAQPGDYRLTNIQSISPGFLQMMKIPLREGRLINDDDGPEQPLVGDISERLAQKYFAGENPIGKSFKIGAEDSPSSWVKIVGIVGDLRYEPWDRDEAPYLYLPYRQAPQRLASLVLRTQGDATAFASAARSKIASVDRDQPVFELESLQTVISNQVLGLAYVAVMLAAVGVIALVLASIGVYGVMAYSVTERTHEIGVRMALGAQQREVLRLVLKRGILMTAIGLLIGLPLAIGLAQLLADLLYGVSSADFATFGGVTLLMCVITLGACYVPARRAARVDPLVALRYE
jgi:putative ABC transport system permease protein